VSKIEIPDDIEICDDCKVEFHMSEMVYVERNGVRYQYCKFCVELIEE